MPIKVFLTTSRIDIFFTLSGITTSEGALVISVLEIKVLTEYLC